MGKNGNGGDAAGSSVAGTAMTVRNLPLSRTVETRENETNRTTFLREWLTGNCVNARGVKWKLGRSLSGKKEVKVNESEEQTGQRGNVETWRRCRR